MPAIDNTLTFQWPIKKNYRLDTSIQTPSSGRGELRIAKYAFPLIDYEWTLGYIPGDATETNSVYQQIQNFLIAVAGSGASFLFLDPYDNLVPVATPQQIGTGDGTTLLFTMVRTLVTGGAAILIQNFVAPPVIYVNGVAVSSSTYTINQYGTLTFNAGHAPGAGQSVSWSGQYYQLCRMTKDKQDFEETMYQIWQCKTFQFQSVLN
jgi:uncharacterized protein (TIGR02217 family)